jgi:hypothetical protein
VTAFDAGAVGACSHMAAGVIDGLRGSQLVKRGNPAHTDCCQASFGHSRKTVGFRTPVEPPVTPTFNNALSEICNTFSDLAFLCQGPFRRCRRITVLGALCLTQIRSAYPLTARTAVCFQASTRRQRRRRAELAVLRKGVFGSTDAKIGDVQHPSDQK